MNVSQKLRLSIRSVIVLSVLVPLFSLLAFGVMQTSGDDSAVASALATTAVAELDSGSVIDANKVMGYRACTICHPSETLAWMSSKHYQSENKIRSFTGNVKKYCEALDITKQGLRSSICAECHATPKSDEAGSVRMEGGVSCESCHGASGSEKGWLNRHAVYGPIGTRAEQETAEHRATRIEYCVNAGMVQTDRLYAIAKNCRTCHTIASEALVNAGHKAFTEGFELIGWTNGEVRHNFHQRQTVNAEGPSLWEWRTGASSKQRSRVLYIVGLLVDIEVNLQALTATKEGEGDYVDAFGEGLGGSLEILNEVLGEVFEDEIPADLSGFGEEGELTEAITELAEDGDFSEEETRQSAAELAKQVAKVAMDFGSKRDGSQLEAVGEFVEENVEAKGEAYQR